MARVRQATSKQAAPSLFDQQPPGAHQVRPPLLMVMDGHAMLFRAWFALKQQSLTIRRTGEDVRGVYGFVSSMFKAIADLHPTHVVIAFDPPGPTFRHEQFEAYKANRPEAPPEFHAQVGRAKQVVTTMHIPIYEVPGYEADDVIGTIAKDASQQGMDTVVFTGDSDTLQLVSPRVRVLMTTGFGDQKLYDEHAVRERYGGLEPSQQIDVKALRGDPSDNIPGVPGIGDKTAVKLIQEFSSVEDLYQRLAEVQPPRVQQLLRDNEDAAHQGKHLVTIVTDAPIGFDLEGARFGQYVREELLDILRELEFNSLVARIPAPNNVLRETTAAYPAVSTTATTEPKATETVLVDTPDALEAMAKELRAAGTIAFDTETTSIDPMRAELVGVSFAGTPGKAYYVPVGHRAGQQLPLDQVMATVRTLLEEPASGKVGHNANFDLTLLANYGVRPESVNLTFDTMLAAHLLGEKALGLKALAFNRLKVEMTNISELIGTGRKQTTFDTVPIADAAPYAAADADMTLRLKEQLEAEMRKEGLLELLVHHEVPVAPVLVRMQTNGIAVDTQVLSGLSDELTGHIQRLEAAVYEDVGHRFNIGSPNQLAEVLYTELKLPKGRRTQTGYSTDAATLEALRKMPPEALADAKPQGFQIVENVLEYRELTKLKSTYVETLPLAVNPKTNRIHTSYNQAGSATGRVASNDPNLQNIPVRTELGRRVRKAFIAEGRPNWLLLAADYSQVELRVLAHLSLDSNLIAAFERDEDIHAATASSVYKVSMDQVTPDMRRVAKAMNFGIIYGLTAFGIAQQTELTVEEGNRFIETYFGNYPRVREYLDQTLIKARQDGYVETLLGRRRYLPELTASNYQVRQATERMAVNMPVQGTAAEIIKEAMVLAQRQLVERRMRSKMLLQVHDELVFEAPKEELEQLRQLVQDVMPNALELVVPLKVEIKTGETWGDME